MSNVQNSIPKPDSDKGMDIRINKAVDSSFYFTVATRSKVALKPFVTDIPMEHQLTAVKLSNAIKGNAKFSTLLQPTNNNVLLAIYYSDSTLTLNVDEKTNQNFSPDLDAIIVASGPDTVGINVGDLVVYETSAGTRIPTKDIMDRKEIRLALTGLKNIEFENMIAGASRINLRMFVLVKQHDIICIRHDA